MAKELKPEEIVKFVYTVVADELAQFIDEYEVGVRKPLAWEELTEKKKAYWYARFAQLSKSHGSTMLTPSRDRSLSKPGLERELKNIIVKLAVGIMIICGKFKVNDLKKVDRERFEERCQIVYERILALLPDEERIRPK